MKKAELIGKYEKKLPVKGCDNCFAALNHFCMINDLYEPHHKDGICSKHRYNSLFIKDAEILTDLNNLEGE